MSNRRISSKAAREFHRQALANGFELIRSKNHLVYHRAGVGTIAVAGSASDKRALQNNLARMNRMCRAA